MCKKLTDPLDGAPFIAGTVTLLKQSHSENTEQFFALLGQYVRSMIASTHGFVHVFMSSYAIFTLSPVTKSIFIVVATTTSFFV